MHHGGCDVCLAGNYVFEHFRSDGCEWYWVVVVGVQTFSLPHVRPSITVDVLLTVCPLSSLCSLVPSSVLSALGWPSRSIALSRWLCQPSTALFVLSSWLYGRRLSTTPLHSGVIGRLPTSSQAFWRTCKQSLVSSMIAKGLVTINVWWMTCYGVDCINQGRTLYDTVQQPAQANKKMNNWKSTHII